MPIAASSAALRRKGALRWRIGAMPSRAHETPEPSRPIMHVVASNDLLVDVLVPVRVWLRWLREGQQFFAERRRVADPADRVASARPSIGQPDREGDRAFLRRYRRHPARHERSHPVQNSSE